MIAPDWIPRAFPRAQTDRKPHRAGARKTVPRLECLERVTLMAASPTIQSITEPALVLSNSLTNFGPPSSIAARPLSPPLPLFNPGLGTLLDVRVTASTTLTSIIRSQNTSLASGATITATQSGTAEIDFPGTNSPVPPITASFNQTAGPVTVQQFNPGTPFNFGPPSGVSFDGVQNPALSSTNNQSFTYSDPASLAFFSATLPRRTTLPVTLSASAQAAANSANGNLTTQVQTPASAVVTVSYDYIPACPTPTRVIRFGVHQQQTQLVVSFSGPLNPTDAQNPSNYTIIQPAPDGSLTSPLAVRIPIASATYSPLSNTVTLVPVVRINAHYKFDLSVNFPCYNGVPATLLFGGKQSLGGFTGGHHKHFFPVVGGHLVRGRA